MVDARLATAAAAVQKILGEEFTYTPLGQAPLTITGVFEESGTVIETVGDNEIETVQPTFTVVKSDIPGGVAKVGDTVLANAITYGVIRVPREDLPDARLILERL